MLNSQYCVFNDGFAIWFDGNSHIDIHINEWIHKKSNYIDLGTRIYNTNNIHNGHIFIPFKLSLNEIKDLSEHFKVEETARGIFNTSCKITIPANNPIIKIEYNNRIENIIPFAMLNPQISDIDDGVLIQLSFDGVIPQLDTQETYLRFRIPHKSLNEHINSLKHNYKTVIESPIISDKIYYTMRINELRSLPSTLRFPLNDYQQIQKIILTLSVNHEYAIDDANCYKIRKLEYDLFHKYVPSFFDCNDTISYQWIDDRHNKHYNFFVKLETKKILYKSILLYALLVILLSFLGNFLWKLLTMIPFLKWLQ